MADARNREFRLTGAHVLAMLIAFFGVIFAVNGLFIYYSQTSWTGLLKGNGYEASLKYNKEAARARAMLARGWQTKVIVARDARIIIELKDKDGEPVSGMKAKVVFMRPVGTEQDRRMILKEKSPGRYETAQPLPLGAWRMDASFLRGDELMWRAQASFLVRPR